MIEPGHERIDELLAGHALGALSGEDAAEVDRLLAEHVPGCPTCRRLLDDYRAVAGDLALAPAPAEAPPSLLVSLRREIVSERAPRRGLPAWVGAAAAVALLTLGGFTAFLTQRVNDAGGQLVAAQNAIDIFTDPGANVVPMEAANAEDDATVGWTTGSGCMIVVENVSRPRRNHPYEVWLTVDGVPTVLAATFLHRRNQTYVEVAHDLSRFDEIWIVESGNGPPGEPVMRARI